MARSFLGTKRACPQARLRYYVLVSVFCRQGRSVPRSRPPPGDNDVLIAQILLPTAPVSGSNDRHVESQVVVEFTNVSLVEADCTFGNVFVICPAAVQGV